MPGSLPVNAESCWPKDVGIVAVEIYFPSQYVDQTELEKYDGVDAGKYTVGLGQSKMGFCSDWEDIKSLFLTVVQKLMERNSLSYDCTGRLEVGTETAAGISGERESDTNTHGVQDLIRLLYKPGRYALAGDIAVYASGNARPAGGAVAVAMLVGPNAPLIFERGLHGTHMQHAYDFYKPDMISEYPIVDGKLCIQCYFSALDCCYAVYRNKIHTQWQKEGTGRHFTLNDFGFMIFHSPYCKLVQKSVARLLLNYFLCDQNLETANGVFSDLEAFRDVKLEDTYFDRVVEKAFMKASAELFNQKTKASLLITNQNGNMYNPSVYGCLASLLAQYPPEQLAGQRISMFSYGFGFVATLYSIRVTQDAAPGSALDKITASLSDLKTRLDSRKCIAPDVFTENMKIRLETHNLANYISQSSVIDLFEGTWYLVHVDEKHRTSYARHPVMGDGPLEAGVEAVHPGLVNEHIPSPVKKAPRIPAATESEGITVATSNGEH